ncbi:MAG: NAD(P)-dependent oxidoreductase [Candidatus Poribacteria bacterium]|nr:NAD(P)-dependent oxidoreductase [Candidatus Poribacteria bacterium]MDE0505844.1 NAD(P)-dependent oxidoreductase [Candidatus Poribacteria bacterium]
MKVLILGANGLLGPHVVKSLEPHYQLRLTDIKPTQTSHESMSVDVSCLDEVMRAAEDMDAIINCSVLRDDRQLAFDVSTRGCFNMMQAAAVHGIPRVINTGPHWTVAGDSYTDYDFELSPDVPPHTGTLLYALTKGLGQEVCKVFTENYDIYLLCYLFLSFREHTDESEGTDLNPFTVSWRDAADAFRLGLEINLDELPSRCEVFNIFADLPHQMFRNEKAKRILGFAPEDNFERMWHKKRK